MARPLAQSPLQRPAAAGRPGMQPAQLRRGAGGRSHGPRQNAHGREQVVAGRRSHGDPTGGQRRPDFRDEPRRPGDPTGGQRRPQYRDEYRRQADVQRPVSSDLMRRRRSNTLFMLVAVVAATLFLAATTQSTFMLYMFAIAFLALCGYGYLLTQASRRDQSSWPQDWMHH